MLCIVFFVLLCFNASIFNISIIFLTYLCIISTNVGEIKLTYLLIWAGLIVNNLSLLISWIERAMSMYY